MRFTIVCCLLLIAGSSLQAQQKKLTPQDYGQWQSVRIGGLSEDGKWAAYVLNRQQDNDTLIVEQLQGSKKYLLEHGSTPVFSQDNKWLVYTIGVPYKQREALTEKREKVPAKMCIMNLATGHKYIVDNVSSYQFSENGQFLMAKLEADKEDKTPGSVYLLRNMVDSTVRTIANVTGYGFDKKSKYLAYTIESSNLAANTVELFNLQNYTIQVIASDTARFSNLTWSKNGDAFAFYKKVKNPDFEEENAAVYVYDLRNQSSKKPLVKVLDPQKEPGFPKGMRINPASSLSLNNEGTAVYFGTNEWTAKPAKPAAASKDSTKAAQQKDSTALATKPAAKADSALAQKKPAVAPAKPVNMDVWHWKDYEIQPRQKMTYMRDKNLNYATSWNIKSNVIVPIAVDSLPAATISLYHSYALSNSVDKYKPAFKEDFTDVYLVNTATGTRKLIAEKAYALGGYIPSLSPDGKYVMYYQDKNWHSYNVATGKVVNLTQAAGQTFENYKNDHPQVKPPFGGGGWLKGDKAVLLYDEYDIYSFQPDGKGFTKLTNGREKQIRHVVYRTSREFPYIDDANPIFVTLYGTKTKFTGYGQLVKGKFQELLYEEKNIGGLMKAEKANVYVFGTQKYDVSPALYTTVDFKNNRLLTETNKQQAEYGWGKSELVNYTSKDGKQLQGSLHYPAHYEPGKQYPMVVYIYEELSSGVHMYVNPNERNPYGTSNYTSDGFFVFRPDIVYEINDPGMSAVNCVVPAVEEVLKTGMIDRNKVGLMGHSWGAYQTAFIVSQTDLFKAAVAGAPLTNMISMSLAIYWNSGTPDQKIFETTQGRFDGPWYEQMQAHERNSPIYHAKNINTPLLVTFGDKDGAVDWHQGIEMYGTMRRMEKNHVMLVYADENHNFTKKENQIDYAKRIKAWFNHYLLNEPAEKWISEGRSYKERMEEEEKAKKGK